MCKMDRLAQKGTNSALMVEGKNDMEFVKQVGINRNIFFPNNAVSIFKADKRKYNESYQDNDVEINSKVFIKDSLKGIHDIDDIDELDQEKKNKIKGWDLYGIIDHDFVKKNPNNPSLGYDKLLCDNKCCDVETLVLYSQQNLVQTTFTNEGLQISEDDIAKGFFMAYQIGLIKYYLTNHYSLKGKWTSLFPYFHFEYTDEILAWLFDDNCTLYIDSLLEKWRSTNATEQDLDDCYYDIVYDRSHQGLLNRQGQWLIRWQDFKRQYPANLFQRISGHDLAAILLYLCPEGKSHFLPDQKDCALESAFVKYYDIEQNFSKTDLYQQLFNKRLLIGES